MSEEIKKNLKPTEFLANYFGITNRRVQQLAQDGIIPYIKEKGPLDNPNTNQRFYKVVNEELIDITHKFWKRETEN